MRYFKLLNYNEARNSIRAIREINCQRQYMVDVEHVEKLFLELTGGGVY